jgi:predicted transposase/invertase (TIGR01784 family)
MVRKRRRGRKGKEKREERRGKRKQGAGEGGEKTFISTHAFGQFVPYIGMKTNKENPPHKWGPFPFGDGKRVWDIRYDPVFKTVFTRGTAESRGALSDLISALIGRVVTVDVIIANEPPVEDKRQRYLRFDIACKTEKDELINVEMSFNPKAWEPVRLEYHAAKLFVGQDIHGKDKDYNDLKETYQIAIISKRRFFQDENFAHNFLYYDPDNRVSLNGRTRIITVELVKTKPIVDKPVEDMTNVELWAVFFEYLTDEKKRGKINEIINREEGIAMAVKTLVTFTQSEIEYINETRRIMAELDYNSEMAERRAKAHAKGLRKGRAEGLRKGLAEGRAEGHAEGEAKGRQEERQYLLDMLNRGLSIEEIKQQLTN